MTALQPQPRPEDDPHERSRRRVSVMKDLMVFQFKLLLEGFKDIVLGPMSLVAALLDVILAKQAPDRYLDATMRLGRRYEESLDLYGALDVPPKPDVPQVGVGGSPPHATIAQDEAPR